MLDGGLKSSFRVAPVLEEDSVRILGGCKGFDHVPAIREQLEVIVELAVVLEAVFLEPELGIAAPGKVEIGFGKRSHTACTHFFLPVQWCGKHFVLVRRTSRRSSGSR